jgi:hypothetical protein
MEPHTLGEIGGSLGGILGVIFGLLGGVVGTYFSIRNTRGPRERAFMVRASIGCWIGVGLFALGFWLLPSARIALVVAYIIALLLAVRYWNRRQAAIRASESENAGPRSG